MIRILFPLLTQPVNARSVGDHRVFAGLAHPLKPVPDIHTCDIRRARRQGIERGRTDTLTG